MPAAPLPQPIVGRDHPVERVGTQPAGDRQQPPPSPHSLTWGFAINPYESSICARRVAHNNFWPAGGNSYRGAMLQPPRATGGRRDDSRILKFPTSTSSPTTWWRRSRPGTFARAMLWRPCCTKTTARLNHTEDLLDEATDELLTKVVRSRELKGPSAHARVRVTSAARDPNEHNALLRELGMEVSAPKPKKQARRVRGEQMLREAGLSQTAGARASACPAPGRERARSPHGRSLGRADLALEGPGAARGAPGRAGDPTRAGPPSRRRSNRRPRD